jgi:hypothetical protein
MFTSTLALRFVFSSGHHHTGHESLAPPAADGRHHEPMVAPLEVRVHAMTAGKSPILDSAQRQP